MRLRIRALRRSPQLAVLLAGATVLALGIVGTAIATTVTGPFEVDDGSDSYAVKGYTYAANNATGVLGYGGNASSFNATGVAGYVTSPSSVGVTGYSASTGANAYGVYGFSTTGNGVYGVSNNSSAASVYGMNSQTGGTAVYGFGNGLGVYGLSITGNGVEGSAGSNSGSGVFGANTGSGEGGYFTSQTGDAIYATSLSSGAVSVLDNANGSAGIFYGDSSTATNAALEAVGETAGTDIFSAYGHSLTENFAIQGKWNGNGPYTLTSGSDVQINGDLYVQGEVYQNCASHGDSFPVTTSTVGNCYFSEYLLAAARAKSLSGKRYTMYPVRQSVPTVEDFGEAQLVNGQANVQLERSFASTIDPSRPYLVFITPEGENRGLYVTAKSPNGFAVREVMGGRSSVAFQYRIVAHPYGDSSARMPLEPAQTGPAAGGQPIPAGDSGAALALRQARISTLRTAPEPKRLPVPATSFVTQHR